MRRRWCLFWLAVFTGVLLGDAIAQAQLAAEQAETAIEADMVAAVAPHRHHWGWYAGELTLGLADAYSTRRVLDLAERSPWVGAEELSPLARHVAHSDALYALPILEALLSRWLDRRWSKRRPWFALSWGTLHAAGAAWNTNNYNRMLRTHREGEELLARICAVRGLLPLVRGLPLGLGCE